VKVSEIKLLIEDVTTNLQIVKAIRGVHSFCEEECENQKHTGILGHVCASLRINENSTHKEFETGIHQVLLLHNINNVGERVGAL
jgi:hypothetical protein